MRGILLDPVACGLEMIYKPGDEIELSGRTEMPTYSTVTDITGTTRKVIANNEVTYTTEIHGEKCEIPAHLIEIIPDVADVAFKAGEYKPATPSEAW